MTMARKNFAKADQGIAAIEFAILGAVLCLIVVGVGDLGLGFYSDMQVQNSAQAGAEYAAVHGYNSAAITNVVTNATSLSGVTASPAPQQFCGCVSGTTVAAATCGTTCASGMTAGTYVSVSAARTYSTLISYPGFPASYSQAATSTVRIQ
ncbi:MAG TPA: TadE/TadG family type IV pilus assembly protein [Rhizomicrobium sp.]|jgi:Flp pilus assembly protein TadG|nr:TadE/TadG family type IV pilus assembly protein [Rhizomicrobium sp.]